MTQISPFKIITVALVLAFIPQVGAATAQVTITYGNPTISNPNYRVQGYTVNSSHQSNRYSYVPSPGKRYQQALPQLGIQGGQYRSGFRGKNIAPYQVYGSTNNAPYQAYRQSQRPVYYSNQTNGDGYYYNDYSQYNGTPSSQPGAVIGGTIGRAIGG